MRRLVTILRCEAAAGVSAALLHIADALAFVAVTIATFGGHLGRDGTGGIARY